MKRQVMIIDLWTMVAAVLVIVFFQNCTGGFNQLELDKENPSSTSASSISNLSLADYSSNPLANSCYCLDCSDIEINSMASELTNKCSYIRWGLYPWNPWEAGRYPETASRGTIDEQFNSLYSVHLRKAVTAAKAKFGNDVFFEASIPEYFNDNYRELKVSQDELRTIDTYLEVSENYYHEKPFKDMPTGHAADFTTPSLDHNIGMRWHFFMGKKALDQGAKALNIPQINLRTSNLDRLSHLVAALRQYARDQGLGKIIIGIESIEDFSESSQLSLKGKVDFIKKVMDTDVAQYDSANKTYYAYDQHGNHLNCYSQEELNSSKLGGAKKSEKSGQLIGQLCLLESKLFENGKAKNRQYNNHGFVHNHLLQNPAKIPVLMELDGCHQCNWTQGKSLTHRATYSNGTTQGYPIYYKDHTKGDADGTDCYSKVRNGLPTTMQFLSLPAVYRQSFVIYATKTAAKLSNQEGFDVFFPRPIKVDQNHYWQIRDGDMDEASQQRSYLRLCPKGLDDLSYSGPDMGLFYRANGNFCGDMNAIDQSLSQEVIAPAFGVDIQVKISGQGAISSKPSAIECTSRCSEMFPKGSSITLMARPANGYKLKSWLGDCSGSVTNCILTTNKSKSVEAVFEPLEQPPMRADGECGVANGKVFATKPITTELCKTGTPSSIPKEGPWNWSCAGQGDGSSSSCVANLPLTTNSDRRTKIDYLYRMILLRPGDIEGLHYYSEAPLTLEEIATQFALSVEYNNRNFSQQSVGDTEFIETLYLIFLKRNADSGGKSYYINKLNTGTSRSSLIRELYNSPEFKNLNPNL